MNFFANAFKRASRRPGVFRVLSLCVAESVLGLWFVSASAGGFSTQESAQVQFGSARVANIQLILGAGARPKYSPAGTRLVFDRRNFDGYYDLYLSDTNGQIIASLTQNRAINQRHNGNGIYEPTPNYIIFISEVQEHFLDFLSPFGPVPFTEPGVGVFNNLWATDGQSFWQLTDIPIMQTIGSGPAMGSVNPRFSADGTTLIWTERYEKGGNHNWGRWRLKAGDLGTGPSGPVLENQRIILEPTLGNYVTAMDFLTPTVLLVAGNLDGQHEFGMDLYRLDLLTGATQNLTNSPEYWEEGSCVAPSGKIVYMTNRDSQFIVDFDQNWVGQPVERDYWIMDPDGSNKERLTFFNDPSAAEYTDWRSLTIVCDISPDGMTIAATIGRDFGDETTARVHWQIWLIELNDPL